MPSLTEWRVPPANQPRPGDYAFDLDKPCRRWSGCIRSSRRRLQRRDARHRARRQRRPDRDGVVLTIGYLITEAETIWLHLGDGRVVPGHVLGLRSGDRLRPGAGARRGSTCRRCRSGLRRPQGRRSRGGRRRRRPHARRSPATSPPSRNSPATGNTCSTRRSSPARRIRSGAAPALIGRAASCSASARCRCSRCARATAEPLNMIVPIAKPVLDDIRKFGRVNKPPRPWLGMYATEIDNRVVVVGIASKGPARARRTQPATSSSRSTATRSPARPASTANSGRSARPASRCRSRSITRASPSTWC